MDINSNRTKELQLIEKALEGDSTKFEILFNSNKDAVKFFLMKLSGNEFDSNDLLQESFIKAYLNLNKYNSNYTFLQWLFTIARNTFIDHVRRKAVKESLLLFDSQLIVDMVGDNPEELLATLERQRTLESNIGELDENSKSIIELRYYKGLSYEEISAELDIPLGTVKTRLHRAKERLSSIINKGKTDSK